ncbi:MAG: hypothetical protein HXY50_07890 [Ignavibacteriaceae bacterium]|nr:hypothetical protein [Ignavibacteriaceae bacterium]
MSTIFNIKKDSYQLLLLTSIAVLVGLTFSQLTKMNFQDKEMFGVPIKAMLWIIPLLLLFLWLLYMLTNRFLYSITITRIHVLITVGTTILIFIVLYIGINPSQVVNENHQLIGNSMQILSLLFVFAQLIYLGNVLLGLFAKRKIISR